MCRVPVAVHVFVCVVVIERVDTGGTEEVESL